MRVHLSEGTRHRRDVVLANNPNHPGALLGRFIDEYNVPSTAIAVVFGVSKGRLNQWVAGDAFPSGEFPDMIFCLLAEARKKFSYQGGAYLERYEAFVAFASLALARYRHTAVPVRVHRLR